MTIRLSIEHEGNRREQVFAGPLVSIGRASDNDICLLNALISRHHCQFDLSGDGVWIEDLASANGVTVNGLKTRGASLCVGDMIEVGSTALKILEIGEGDVALEEEDSPFRTILSELPDEREKLRVFARLTRELSKEQDPISLFKLIVDDAIALLGGERGFLMFPDSEVEDASAITPEEMKVHVARSFDGADIALPSTRVSLNIIKSVLESGESLLSLDAAQDERFEGFESIEGLRLKSVVCLPVSYAGAVRGVLIVDNRLRQGVFKEEDLEIAELFADQAAVALQNARRRQEMSQHSLRLEQSRREIAALNTELGKKVKDQGAELSVVRAELGRERARGDYGAIVGASDSMKAVFESLDRIMESSLPVLITGESGTGKELIARAIHKNGARSKRPFISENCSAIPESLLESELFGHVKGAFTGAHRTKKGLFETADSGTLFLDEIGDMSPAMQAKLLRVLQEGKVRPVGSDKLIDVDVRLLAASHRDLAKQVSEGSFREDLFYRIYVLMVELPPLRERVDDIPILAEHLLVRAGREAGRPVPVLPQEVIVALCKHNWPGNVRELENEMRRLLVLAPEQIVLSSLSAAVRETSGGVNARALEGDLRETIAEFERSAIEAALERAGGNKSQAARKLGISRFALQRKLDKYGFETGEVSEPGEAKLEP